MNITTAMSTKQSKHIIPVHKSSPVLISNGAEQSIHYNLCNDFSVVATQDGTVKEITHNIMIVEYKDGTHQAIDLATNVVKNGAGGFYLPNKMVSDFKVGSKFKANEVLAQHNQFFSKDEINGSRFNIGTLEKIAICSTGENYEDSAFVSKKMTRDIASDIVMKKPVTLGKNATVDYIVNVGDKIEVGDELIRFEASHSEGFVNDLLANIGEETGEQIKSLSKKPVKSKYSGIIEDIKIYATVELEELSPSLQKLVSSYYSEVNKKKKLLEKYKNSDETSIIKAGLMFTTATGKIEAKEGKIKGEYVGEGILIEFYIKYTDIAAIGDKITYFTALKSIIGDVVEEGQEPFSVNEPDEEISTFLPPGSIQARMTPSIYKTMFANKLLVNHKRNLEKMYKGEM